jgi:hypothetical protein
MEEILRKLDIVQSSVSIVSMNLTPSDTCSSKAEIPYRTLMDTLSLPSDMSVADLPKEVDAAPGLYPFSYPWGRRSESEAYEPVIQYLNACHHLKGVNIANGQRLSHGHLFAVQVFSLRPNLLVASSELRQTKTGPRHRFNVLGTSDIFVSLNPAGRIERANCAFCIEIKRVGDMSSRSGINRCLREGIIQLIGLNVANTNTSPSVLVTNLNGQHYVLYISKNPNPEKLQYTLNLLQCSTFCRSVDYIRDTLMRRQCITHDFGSPLSPEGSVTYYEEDDDDMFDADAKVILTEV